MTPLPTIFEDARLVDPEAGTVAAGALVVEAGRIARVLPEGAPLPRGQRIECHGWCLAPGLIDLGVKIGEPGERHKESFRSAGRAAAARAA